MSADRTRVINRTLEILNLVAPATYGGAISSRNKTRNLTALTDMVDEAGLQILKAIAERPNEFRYPFLANVTVTTSGTQMPAHLGPPASILITLYEDGPVKEADRRDYRRIQSYRENLNEIYDNTANHNEFGSSLAGYYDIWDDRFYFTGFSATLYSA